MYKHWTHVEGEVQTSLDRQILEQDQTDEPIPKRKEQNNHQPNIQ